jgi:putative serine protease PepD
MTLGGRSTLTTLRVVYDDHERVVLPGATATIGRDASCTIHVDNPLVSRLHARIEPTATGWAIVDAESRTGLFWDEAQVQRQELSGLMRFWLGPPEAGERLVVLAPGKQIASPEEREERSRSRLTRFVGIAAICALVVAIAGAVVVIRHNGSKPSTLTRTINHTINRTVTPKAPDLASLERATVQLIQVVNGQPQGWGSGVIVGSHGLILTNAHVAEPSAVGIDEPDPDYLIVRVTDQPDQPVQSQYQARVVEAGDGFKDLAVVRIDADENGSPIDTSTIDLPTVPIGTSESVHTGDPVWVLGFPGISTTDPNALANAAVTVTNGDISNVERGDQFRQEVQAAAAASDPPVDVPPDFLDPSLDDAPIIISTTATIAHGNSGGLAADSSGRLIGIPTAVQEDTDANGAASGATSGKILAIDLAKDLIAEAGTG